MHIAAGLDDATRSRAATAAARTAHTIGLDAWTTAITLISNTSTCIYTSCLMIFYTQWLMNSVIASMQE